MPKSSTLGAPNVKLVPLQIGLKHALLGSGDTFLIIISSKLSASQEKQLIDLLKEHRYALGSITVNIEGITLLICSYKIHLEERVNPCRDP